MSKRDRVNRAKAAGKRRGWEERKGALERYHQSPHFCLNCRKMLEVGNKRVADVIKKKFCNYSCSASFHNRNRHSLTGTAAAT